MGYCTVIQVDQLLANAMSSARPDATGQKLTLINISASNSSTPVGVNRIPDEIVEYYISLADSFIDGILSQMYKTPLRKCARGQWQLDSDINEYNQTVEIDTRNLVEGQEILIRDDNSGNEELHTILSIVDQDSLLTIDPIVTHFSGDEVRVVRIAYPAPIDMISARYAVSLIYDKYYASQNDPNISEYGKELRNWAMGQINDILNGRTILDCQERIGDRFASPTLDSTYALRALPQQFDVNSRDMSRPR